MKGRIKEDDSSVPTPDVPWDYYVRYDLGAQHPVHARRPRGQAQGEQVLLDEPALSTGAAFFQVGAPSPTPDPPLFPCPPDSHGPFSSPFPLQPLPPLSPPFSPLLPRFPSLP